MFFIHHLYTAILVSVEEQSGLMDSIFSGYKFVSSKELEHEMSDLGIAAAEQPHSATSPVIAEDIQEKDSSMLV
jgi:Ni/Fe-hydrogenase 1 B-type cytochrome subunit